MRLHGVHDLLGVVAAAQLLDRHARMAGLEVRVALVVHVVHESGDAPRSPRPRPNRRAYARTAVSTASMCLRSESDSVHSHTSCQASSRVGMVASLLRACSDSPAAGSRDVEP